MEWIIGILCIVIVICVLTVSIVLHNFMLLLSELNKRQIYIISDILQSIDLSTPHLDTIMPSDATINVEDILEDEVPKENYFNPHEYNPEKDS